MLFTFHIFTLSEKKSCAVLFRLSSINLYTTFICQVLKYSTNQYINKCKKRALDKS